MIKLIVAYDEMRGIGYKNTIPWFIKGELKWVADKTKLTMDSGKSNALIMGRKTWESLPKERRPLVGRINIVISKETVIREDEDVMTFKSVEDAVEWCNINKMLVESAFIFGGSSIYKHALENNLVDMVLATEVDGEYKCDTFFPELPNVFKLTHKEFCEYGEQIVRRLIFIKY